MQRLQSKRDWKEKKNFNISITKCMRLVNVLFLLTSVAPHHETSSSDCETWASVECCTALEWLTDSAWPVSVAPDPCSS